MPKNPSTKPRLIRSPNLSKEELAGLEGAGVLKPAEMDKAIVGTVANADGKLLLVYSFLDMVEVTKTRLEQERRRAQKQKSHKTRREPDEEPGSDAANLELGGLDLSEAAFEDDEESRDEDVLYEEAQDYTSYEYLSYIGSSGKWVGTPG